MIPAISSLSRTLPPTGAPIRLWDLVRCIPALAWGDEAEAGFADVLKTYFGVAHAFLVSSGKGAISMALSGLQRISDRREVIIPAYASFCLASAVARAGLPVKLCDVDPGTLDFDFDRLHRLVDERTLAVIPVHNYGLVCNMAEICALASEKGAWVIEDAAQAAGAEWEGRKAGSVGDIGILSLGRGKNICALSGGVILTSNEDLADTIAKEAARYAYPPLLSNAAGLAVGVALSVFLNPALYAIPSNLPFLKLGANVYDPGFDVHRLSPVNAEAGLKTFPNLDRYNEIRMENALFLRAGLSSRDSIGVPAPDPRGRSVYLRFPVLPGSRREREDAYSRAAALRLGVTRSYPTPLGDIPDFRKYLVFGAGDDYPGARSVAERVLTLPTHPYVSKEDLSSIINIIEGM